MAYIIDNELDQEMIVSSHELHGYILSTFHI